MSLTQINKAGLDEIALDHVFTIGASGTNHYTFQGEGLNGTVNDPTLYLTRGQTYRFENGTGAHPIRIQSTSGSSGTAYNTGVTNNAGSGTVIVEVQHDAPDVLYYQCTSHPAMNGVLYITGALADGGVTTDKLANNSVTSAKIVDASILQNDISDNAISTAKLQNDAVTSAKIADDAVTDAQIADGAVTTTRIADDAVDSTKLSAGAVDQTAISNNAVTTNKIATNAVTTTKIAADNIVNSLIADNAVENANIANSAITTAKIATGAVTGVKIAAEIDNSHITATANIAGSKLADGSITQAKLSVPVANENMVINGSMIVSQRGTVTGITNNASAYGGPDRFKVTVVNHGTYTASQENDAPYGFAKSLKVDNTSQASSPASNARLYVQHKIEKQNLVHLKKGTSDALQVTVQFWVKSNKTGTYVFELWDNVNNRHVSANYTISSSATWEKKTITLPADTGGNAYDGSNPTGSGFDLNWWLAAGSSFTSGSLATTWTGNSDTQRVVGITANVGNSGYWQLTGVKFEVGSVATPFVFRTQAEELQLCKRYFNNFGATTATGGSATYMLIQGGYARFGGANSIALQRIFYDVEMRTTPTIKYGRNTDNDDFAVMRWSSAGSNPVVYLGSTEGSNRCGFQITRYNAGSGSNPVTETYNDGDSYTHSVNKFRADAEL